MTEDKRNIPMRYADAAMYQSEPMPTENGGVVPQVTLLHMTADPLGAMAAANMMYGGVVVRKLSDVPDHERIKVMEDMAKTRLTAPLEFVDLHFMVEGVTRAFTHQMVRQRTAVYAQESMRFSVVEGQRWKERCALPPSIANVDDPTRDEIWYAALAQAQSHYEALIEQGVPAEDARGIMPHAMTTRLHYKTNLRNLVDHVGNRLCTQAQFEWRKVAIGFADAIRGYGKADNEAHTPAYVYDDQRWQYEAIANSWMFSPVCYHTGKCEFNSSKDRFCAIRKKVEDFHAHGVPSSYWDARDYEDGDLILPDGTKLDGIFPAEWLMDHTAARDI